MNIEHAAKVREIGEMVGAYFASAGNANARVLHELEVDQAINFATGMSDWAEAVEFVRGFFLPAERESFMISEQGKLEWATAKIMERDNELRWSLEDMRRRLS